MKRLILSLFILTTVNTQAQTFFDFTTQEKRAKHDQVLIDSVILMSLQHQLSNTTEKEWMKAFWAMELLLYKTSFTKQKLVTAWKMAGVLSENFQKALLEVSYTLYPGVFNKDVSDLLRQTNAPTVFIRCAEYLLRGKAQRSAEIETLLQQKFANNNFSGFVILKQRLKKNAGSNTPVLKDIFSKNFLPGQTVIYSLQRRNRDYPGLTIIRTSDGSLLKSTDGSFFHVTQLARAITNYPFYITNGNTPQGIFRWTGFDTSSISYIGPTPNLQMVMPYEASPEIFFNNKNDSSINWSKQLYATLLPASWKNYIGIYESYFAGAIGRSEIIMHGTTINPDYYKGQTYFPQTPSLGCLCSYEKWGSNGQLTVSHQQMLVDALKSIGSESGYVVVIEIDDKKSAISLKEVKDILP